MNAEALYERSPSVSDAENSLALGAQPDSTRSALGGERGFHVRQSVRIETLVADVYRFWRRLENLSRFMTHLNRVTEMPDGMLLASASAIDDFAAATAKHPTSPGKPTRLACKRHPINKETRRWPKQGRSTMHSLTNSAIHTTPRNS
jgi:hypothetical protein